MYRRRGRPLGRIRGRGREVVLPSTVHPLTDQASIRHKLGRQIMRLTLETPSSRNHLTQAKQTNNNSNTITETTRHPGVTTAAHRMDSKIHRCNMKALDQRDQAYHYRSLNGPVALCVWPHLQHRLPPNLPMLI